MRSNPNTKEYVESEEHRSENTLLACPECGRISPAEIYAKSHWTNQHRELGEFPGADTVSIDIEMGAFK